MNGACRCVLYYWLLSSQLQPTLRQLNSSNSWTVKLSRRDTSPYRAACRHREFLNVFDSISTIYSCSFKRLVHKARSTFGQYTWFSSLVYQPYSTRNLGLFPWSWLLMWESKERKLWALQCNYFRTYSILYDHGVITSQIDGQTDVAVPRSMLNTSHGKNQCDMWKWKTFKWSMKAVSRVPLSTRIAIQPPTDKTLPFLLKITLFHQKIQAGCNLGCDCINNVSSRQILPQEAVEITTTVNSFKSQLEINYKKAMLSQRWPRDAPYRVLWKFWEVPESIDAQS